MGQPEGRSDEVSSGACNPDGESHFRAVATHDGNADRRARGPAIPSVQALSGAEPGVHANSRRRAAGRLAHCSSADADRQTDGSGRLRDERRRGAVGRCGRVRLGGGHARNGQPVSSIPGRADCPLDQATRLDLPPA